MGGPCSWLRVPRRCAAGSPRSSPRPRSCGPPWMPRFAERLARLAGVAGGAGALAASGRVPPVRRTGGRTGRRRTGLLALPRTLASGRRAALPPLRPAGFRRPGMPDLRRLATGPHPRPERRVAGAVGAPGGALPQVRGMVAGRRGDGGSDADAGAIDRAGILDTCSSRGPAGAGPGVQPERTNRRGARPAEPACPSGGTCSGECARPVPRPPSHPRRDRPTWPAPSGAMGPRGWRWSWWTMSSPPAPRWRRRRRR